MAIPTIDDDPAKRGLILDALTPGREVLPTSSGLYWVLYEDPMNEKPTGAYQGFILTEDTGETAFIKDLGAVKKLQVNPEQLLALQGTLEGTTLSIDPAKRLDLYIQRSENSFTLSNGDPENPTRQNFSRTGPADYVYNPESNREQIQALMTGRFQDREQVVKLLLDMLNSGAQI